MLRLVLFASAAAAMVGPAPRFDSWKVIGPGGGGTTLAPTVSPHDPRMVVEHCDMTGGYITLDNGSSWRMFNLRGGIGTFAFDPGDPKTIYAGNAALWRSTDSGRSWRMLFPDPAKGTVEHQSGDHADYQLTSADKQYPAGGSISAIAAGPGRRIQVAFTDRQTRGAVVFVSADGGASFERARELPGERVLLFHGPLTITNKQVLDSTEARPGPQDGINQASAGEAGGTTYLYATTRSGALFVSEDRGRTWQNRTPALNQKVARLEAVAASLANGRVAYAGFRGPRMGEQSEDLYNGIVKTVDGGRNWTVVFRESTRPASNLAATWIEERARQGGHDIWFDAPAGLGVAPSNPDICYATDLFRTYRTLDGGRSWEEVNSVRAGANGWTTRGLDVTTNYGVHFDPFDARHIFIDYTDIGAFHSFDGGRSWEGATTGVPARWRNTTYWLELDPQVKGLAWGAFSGVHDLPRPKMFRRRDVWRYSGGVGVSSDGGRTWSPSNGGMPETAVTHLLLDPVSPAGKRTLYACGFGRGVYKSTDNGKTWSLKNEGIAEQKPFAWRLTRAGDGTLYLIVARNNEGNFGDPGGGAIYKSTDGAEHWTSLPLPEGCNGPNGLTLDPRDNRRMYLAAWGQGRPDVDAGGGVFLSTDGGGTWKQIFRESQHVYDVTVDPREPRVLYLCGFDAGAWRSTDSGAHWTRIRGYNFKWGHRVALDPNDRSKIYVTTYGGSVWHGPAAGDPKAAEDVATPVPVQQ